ncbi:MAG: tetratricopeptide repeat protein [Acidobacteriota bacterium]|nr:tetratricopeptide repeat protein [Acidobacteriota bacterium]
MKSDPDDVIALQKLANYYLQLHRETADVRYLELALRSARSSLRVLPADQNLGGLLALAQAEYQTHDFSSARDHAKELTEYQPRKSYGYQVLGDALLELGDYEQAEQAYSKMEELDRGSVATETRLAHLALLRGDPATAQRRYVIALVQANAALVPSAESIAWCHWQLGETTFAIGDYPAAERHYRDALTTFPDYFRALGSLGRIRAALGDRADAIEQYEHAVRIVPDPQFVAMLGDLYKLAGRDKDAASRYSLVEKIARLSELNGALYNRQVAVFYADHDLKPEEGYAKALREYGVRRDIYGADAVAWTALKAGKIAEAQSAIAEALRLGTKDARLFYHAGMIARAAGEKSAARDYLKRALALNPQFDPLQAPIARKALEE